MPTSSAIAHAVGPPLPSIISRLAACNIGLRIAPARSPRRFVGAGALEVCRFNRIAIQHLAAAHIAAAVLVKAIAPVHNAAVVPDNEI